MKIFNKEYDDNKVKKIAYTAVAVALVGWFVFRFVMVVIENRMQVFNPVRDAKENGVLVESVVAAKQDGVIKIPLVVKNNRAYVSPTRLGKLKVGQKIGDGKITFVSNSLDLDSGMYIVKTSGVSDGMNYVQVKFNCYFIPVYAVRNNQVMIVNNGISVAKHVNIVAQDSDVACVSGGINNGDTVILSNVDENQKINIKR
ncbi:MAG: hypothetical protein K5912_00990 [Alphaproteobacteria bacterium]|nr:hypothetical protein [Alphaproteobacteria bacterium]